MSVLERRMIATADVYQALTVVLDWTRENPTIAYGIDRQEMEHARDYIATLLPVGHPKRET